MLTWSLIQLPGVVFSFLIALYPKKRFYLLSLIVVPYPLVVWSYQIFSLFKFDSKIESHSHLLLFIEGSIEAAPQIILQMFIILKSAHREISLIQIMAVMSAVLSAAKASLLQFTTGLSHGNKSPVTLSDKPMLFDKSFIEKLKIILKIFPAFFFSLLFKVSE